MPEEKNLLTKFFDKSIAEDLGIKPEQITQEFIEMMSRRIRRDRKFKSCGKSISPKEMEAWNKKCRIWAQEVLQKIQLGETNHEEFISNKRFGAICG